MYVFFLLQFQGHITYLSVFSTKVCVWYRKCNFPSVTFKPRMPFNKRSLSGSHSSHSNLSQASVTSDLLAGDDVDSPISAQHAKIAERRSNGSTDIQGTQVYI